MIPVRLLLLDDHLLFREGLSRLLSEEPDFSVVAQCSGSEEALQILRSGLAPDLILLDFDLGEENAFAFLDALAEMGFAGKVLLVTAGMSARDTERALRAGASGLFLKHAPPARFVEAIRQLMRGEPPAGGLLTGSAGGRLPERHRTPSLRLSAREQAVLRGIFAGLANKEIAAHNGISEGYVKAVLQQLFAKTGVRTRAQLVRIALENRLGAAPPDAGDAP